MDERITGTVKWFSNPKGFGFITADGDDQTLEADDRVSFVLKQTDKGIQATEVQVI